MKGCDDQNIQLYLDGELHGKNLEEFCGHLKKCTVCVQELKTEEELISLLHRTRPLYPAPEALRRRISSEHAMARLTGKKN